MRILVLEASTSSIKAMVYDVLKGVEVIQTAPFDASYSDGISQDAQKVYDALIGLGNKVCKGKEIAAVSVVGVWHNLLIVDENGSPLTRAYAWNDTTAAPSVAKLYENRPLVLELYRRTGCVPHSTYPAYRLMHRKKQGRILTKGQKIICQSSYVFSRMTGELAESVSTASGSGFLNIHQLKWDEKALETVGVDSSFFPPLVTHEDVRPLHKAAAERLGIRAGLPVVPAHPDGAMNQVGAGALRPGVMTVSAGTSGALRVASGQAHIPDIPSSWCYYAPGKWLVGAATAGCTNCIDWWKEKILCDMFSFEQLDAMICDLKAKTPVFLPFLAGERCPGWNDIRKGNFGEISQMHTLGDVYLAILKGITFNMMQCYELLRARMGEPERICVSGGITKSEKWLKLMAAVFGKEIWSSKEEQASMLGGCALAMRALGVIQHLEEFDRGTYKRIEPNTEEVDFFAREYQEYLKEYTSK